MKTLGLDIGPNSIGWALIAVDQNGSPTADPTLEAVGVRVFPEGVDNFDVAGKELSRMEARRVARGMRRQTTRRRRRKLILRQALVKASLLPAEPAALEQILQEDPYLLRARALTGTLSPHQIGRVLLHLNKRRGFLSNRKSDKGDNELKGMLAEIDDLAKQIGDGTLGAHLAALRTDTTAKVRGKHTRRSMLVDEFNRIWQAQAAHHPQLLTDQLRYGIAGPQQQPRKPRRTGDGRDWLTAYGIEGILFFQRSMFWPASMIGKCEFEKTERRCARADRDFQRFRMLQEVNNLRYIDPDRNTECALTDEQRILLLDKLSKSDKATFDQMRNWFGFIESIRFNLENGKRTKIDGHKTDVLMARAWKPWHQQSEDFKNHVVRILLDPKLDDSGVMNELHKADIDTSAATALAAVDLPAGYGSLSLKAIAKLNPHLERGLRYMATNDAEQSAIHAAGYLRHDEMARKLFDKLPSLEFIRSGPLADIGNPVVRTALHELRRVVNAILRTHGQIDAIHVELARSMKMNLDKRQEYNKKIRQRETERNAAADYLRDKDIPLSRNAILRYELWQQQSEKCIYSGKPISFGELFGGSVEIDHILPYSQTLDDSQNNKVVCLTESNRGKGQKTPFEWLAAANPQHYETVCQRARALSYPKYRKFIQEKLDLDDFIERQLRDTAYINKLACNYLKMLVPNDHDVLGLKGQYTAELRHQWGLDTVLEQLPDSPAWIEDGQERPGEKNRADHRHHAIDAIVVALTNRSALQKLSRIIKTGGVRNTGESLPEPHSHFRDSVVEKVKAICVSHRVQRKVSGKLHEETVYGPMNDNTGRQLPGQFVVRKPVENLSLDEVDRIRDQAIRKIIIDAIAAEGLTAGRSKKGAAKPADLANRMKKALANLTMPSGVPIKKVRVIRQEETIRPIRQNKAAQAGDPTQIAYVKPGSTHHLAIFEWVEKGKRVRDAVFVTMLDATRRVRDKQTIIQRTHPTRQDAKFIMSLSAGEMVLANVKGRQKILKFRTAASTQGQIYFCEHTDARKSAEYRKYVFSCNTLDARKITIDPVGRIRWAND